MLSLCPYDCSRTHNLSVKTHTFSSAYSLPRAPSALLPPPYYICLTSTGLVDAALRRLFVTLDNLLRLGKVQINLPFLSTFRNFAAMIFYISCTGNTRWAAERLAEATNDQLVFIPDVIDGDCTFETQDKDAWIVFPVHGWRRWRYWKRI